MSLWAQVRVRVRRVRVRARRVRVTSILFEIVRVRGKGEVLMNQ